MTNKQKFFERLKLTFEKNKQQLKIGPYAAELSFFIMLSLIPILLAFANIIAVLPISSDTILFTLDQFIPEDLRSILTPILEGYIKGTSSNVFSIGLIFSLWPASNVFNAMQRIMNEIYRTKPRPNMVISRLFAYLVTILMVIFIFIMTSLIVFGESILSFVRKHLPIDLGFLSFIIKQGWIITLLVAILILIFIYYVLPNVKWQIKYAIPGSIFSIIGFGVVSLLFPLYLNFSSKRLGTQAIGMFIVMMIWLYFNSMVVVSGAYINVFYHDYKLLNETNNDSNVVERQISQ